MTTIPCPHSRKELRFASYPLVSFCILIFYKETFHFSPRNLRIEDFADPSRRLAEKGQGIVLSACKSIMFFIWQAGLLKSLIKGIRANFRVLIHTDSKMAMPFLPTANNVCGLYPFSPEREMFRKLSFASSYKTLLSTRQTERLWWLPFRLKNIAHQHAFLCNEEKAGIWDLVGKWTIKNSSFTRFLV